MQIRGARAMLGWSATELCERAGISRRTLVKLESSDGIPTTTTTTLEKLRATLEAAGIEFIGSANDRPGIRIGQRPRESDTS
ncbi:helix-turn-helix domain-containing protein [Aestuariicoccus sp. MJ-SS9]|uniref:helix-turn-helix domain-containing protein n=1 Tax=Aestuariicoccus sp. MJ-SS9 TaxID=3079855 RepID=UPI003977A4C1